MPEINAVVGYVPDKVAKALGSKGKPTETVELKLDRGSDNATYVRISPGDIAGVLVGASQKGETGVQVFLKEKANVETVSRGLVADFLTPIRDLSFLKFRVPINVIYVDPQFLNRLVELGTLKK